MKVRINDIECRQINSKNTDQYEMVQWYPNSYYGKEEEMIKEGYEKRVYSDGSWSMNKPYHAINSSCFQNPESCMLIAFLDLNRSEPDLDMRTVGSRLLDLSIQERNHFFRVYKIASEIILAEADEQYKKESKR